MREGSPLLSVRPPTPTCPDLTPLSLSLSLCFLLPVATLVLLLPRRLSSLPIQEEKVNYFLRVVATGSRKQRERERVRADK